MIKGPELKRFLKRCVVPEFENFHLYKNDMLLRVTSIFVHGIYFQRSIVHGELYVHPFVNFLTSGTDYIGLTLGERVARVDMPDSHDSMFKLEPPEEEADVIVRSIRANRFYPYVMNPACRSLLDSFEGVLDAVWVLYGLGCCAIMEGDVTRARRLLRQFDDKVVVLGSDWGRRAHELYLTIDKRLNDLDWCRDFLWERSAEAVRLRKLEKIAELSGWRPGGLQR